MRAILKKNVMPDLEYAFTFVYESISRPGDLDLWPFGL